MDDLLGVIETSIYADDLESAKRFYSDVLGLALLGAEPGRSLFFGVGRASMLLVFRPGATLKSDHVPPHGASGPSHFAFGVRAGALAGWRERLARHGVPIEKEVQWSRGGLSLYFRDPAGNSVEILTPGVWGLPAGW